MPQALRRLGEGSTNSDDTANLRVILLSDGLLQQPVSGLGYRAQPISEKKNKGVWTNPDVAGLLVVPNLAGGAEVEIATIEAKITVTRIDQDFFEAVAHKRFANRVYFAFAVTRNTKILSEFREVGERYNIGILVIQLEADDFQLLVEGDVTNLKITEENAEIIKYWPARFETISPSATAMFLRDSLNLETTKDLYTWGVDPKI